MAKPTIMVDMDDVLLEGGFLKLLNAYLKTNYKVTDFNGFYKQNVVPKEQMQEFFDYFLARNMYDYCEVTPYSIEILKELQQYYDIYIGTAYIFREDYEKCAIMPYYKHLCLLKHYPFITPDHYIFINNKSLLQMDIKIDDRIHNLENAKTKLLFTAYHNRLLTLEDLNKDGVERMDNWLQIRERLLK